MNQKGQIETILILLVLIGLVFYLKFFGKKTETPTVVSQPTTSTQKILKPSPTEKPPQKETKTSETKKEVKEVDTTPPKRFNPQPRGELPAQTRKTIISLETDEKANCRYARVSGLSYDSMNNFFAQTNATSHSAEIGYLSEGEEYIFYVKCQDEFGNKNTDDFEISFSVKKAEDKTPPVRKWLSPTGTLPADTTQVELTVGTDEKANCYYSTLSGKSFWGGSASFSPNETHTFHTAKIYNLTSGKVYDYFVRCCDFFGNCNDDDALIRFGIGLSP
jgi:hypothetical protein